MPEKFNHGYLMVDSYSQGKELLNIAGATFRRV